MLAGRRREAGDTAMLQMIIANRLRDGLVVFLADEEGRWDGAITEGAVIADAGEAARLLEIAKRHEVEAKIVDPQLIEVTVEGGAPRPTAIREAIRAFGPSVRTDLTEVSGEKHVPLR